MSGARTGVPTVLCERDVKIGEDPLPLGVGVVPAAREERLSTLLAVDPL